MLSCDDYLWRKLAFTGSSRGFGGRELWSFWPASTVDRCGSGRAGWYSIVDAARNPSGFPGTRIKSSCTPARDSSMDDSATLDDFREAVTMLENTEPTARRVMGGAHPLTIELDLRRARAVLHARETTLSPPARVV